MLSLTSVSGETRAPLQGNLSPAGAEEGGSRGPVRFPHRPQGVTTAAETLMFRRFGPFQEKGFGSPNSESKQVLGHLVCSGQLPMPPCLLEQPGKDGADWSRKPHAPHPEPAFPPSTCTPQSRPGLKQWQSDKSYPPPKYVQGQRAFPKVGSFKRPLFKKSH